MKTLETNEYINDLRIFFDIKHRKYKMFVKNNNNIYSFYISKSLYDRLKEINNG